MEPSLRLLGLNAALGLIVVTKEFNVVGQMNIPMCWTVNGLTSLVCLMASTD